MTDRSPVPRSLVWATDIDVLPPDRVIRRHDGYLVVRSPSNPSHYFGNLLVFDDPPGAGDGERWEEIFRIEFGDEPRIRHTTFAWDRIDGARGAVQAEFLDRGYDLDESAGLVADAGGVRPHPRENREVEVRALDPAVGADEELWDAVVELQVAGREAGHTEADYRDFSRMRLDDRRIHFRAGRGAWYMALDPESGAVAASCGVVVTGGRGRFQAVDTALEFRRRGICSRLVVEAAQRSATVHDAERFVIAAEVGYHALGLYESLGFERREHVMAVCRWPRSTE